MNGLSVFAIMNLFCNNSITNILPIGIAQRDQRGRNTFCIDTFCRFTFIKKKRLSADHTGGTAVRILIAIVLHDTFTANSILTNHLLNTQASTLSVFVGDVFPVPQIEAVGHSAKLLDSSNGCLC